MSITLLQTVRMKMEIMLDYQSILENRRDTIFFAVRLRAEPASMPPEPTAYALIIDNNNLSDLVLRLAENIIRHLPDNSRLALIHAPQSEPIYPLGDVLDKQSLIALLHQLDPEIAENLSAAWPLAIAELQSATTDRRKILYLTHDPAIESLLSLPTSAAADHNIPTSIFAARPGPAANLLDHLAKIGHGRFYKNFSHDELNAITAAEVGALLRPVAQNVRLRLKPLDFCEAIEPLGAHGDHKFPLENGWIEFNLPDCLAGEDRTVCFNLQVPRLPCIDGEPITTLEKESLLQLELYYDEITPDCVSPRLIRETIRVENQTRPQPAAESPENFERRPKYAPSPVGRGAS